MLGTGSKSLLPSEGREVVLHLGGKGICWATPCCGGGGVLRVGNQGIWAVLLLVGREGGGCDRMLLVSDVPQWKGEGGWVVRCVGSDGGGGALHPRRSSIPLARDATQ